MITPINLAAMLGFSSSHICLCDETSITVRYKKRIKRFISIGLIISAIWLAGMQTAFPENSSEGEAAQSAHVDPRTGEFIEQPSIPSSASVKAEEARAFISSDEGLVETPSSIEGGGTMVDLKGRFRSPLTATTNKDGSVSITHEPIHQTINKNNEE